MTDYGLIKEVEYGNRGAFREVLRKYIPLVSRTSYRITCDRADSELITRKVFQYLWSHPEYFRSGYSLSLRLLTLTCALCRKRLFLRRLLMLLSINPDIFVVSSPSVPSEDEYLVRQAWEIFCRASVSCSDKERIIYTLCELEGLDKEEAAMAGRFLTVSVPRALDQARLKVKEELDYYGRMNDYPAYVIYLRRVEDQLTDLIFLERNIMDALDSS